MRHASYRDELIMALRLRDIPGDRIGEIVAEVDSHVAETGEQPAEAFGPAREYAQQFSTSAGTLWTPGTLAAVVVGLVGTTLLVAAVFDVVTDAAGHTFGLPSWVALLVAVLLTVTSWVLLLSLRDPVVDPVRPDPHRRSLVTGAVARTAVMVTALTVLAYAVTLVSR